MLRLPQALWFVLPAVLATACPMYPDGCNGSGDCAAGYACDATGACVHLDADEGEGVPPDPDTPSRCEDGECPEGLVCDRYQRCVPPDDSAGGASGGAGAPASGAGGEAGVS